MSRLKKGSIPAYRHHKARDLGVVTIEGHDYYLGPYNTPASKQKYANLIRIWQERQDQPLDARKTIPLEPDDHRSVNDLILGFLKHVKDYYRPNHGENKEAGCIADALVILGKLHGRESADAFCPKDLKRVREAMIERHWSRRYINAQVNRIKRMFGWAVEEGLAAGSVYHALLAVKGLRKGTPGVRETKKVKPVPGAQLKAVLGKAPPVLKAMIRFAYRTGARPNEVCILKPCLLDRTEKVWKYTVPPEVNKTEHYNDDEEEGSVIFIGPRAQRVLLPWLEGLQPEEYVFSPARAEAIRQVERRKKRKTPLYPSHVKRLETKKKVNPKRAKRSHYDPASFRRAIKRLCKAAGVPEWAPNRLRHNAATLFRKKYGIEVARLLLRHRKLNTTEIYAEPNARRASRAAFELG
jgi:integrase